MSIEQLRTAEERGKLRDKAIKRREREFEAAFKGMMRGREGRLVLWAILEKCHVYGSSFTGEAERTAFLEGERNIGLYLMAQMHALCPAEFSQMSSEAKARDDEDNRPMKAADQPEQET